MFDLENSREVETLDSVPEDWRPMYTKLESGKFGIAPALEPLVRVFSGARSALATSRQSENNARAQAKAAEVWKTLGDSPEVVQNRIAELESQVKEASKGKIDLEAVRAEFQKNLKTEIEAKEAELQAMTAQLHKHLIQNKAKGALAAAGDREALLLPYVEEKAQVEKDENGEFVVRIRDDSGAIRFGSDLQPLTVEGLVKLMRSEKRYARVFDADTPGGTGVPPSSNGSGRGLPPGPKSSTDLISEGLSDRDRRR